MPAANENIPGVTVDVTDLTNIRSHISGLSLNRIRLASSDGAGARETRIRGRGMEYEESRIYISGDDVRTMDWRVMARTGEAHTKVFAEEKERSILLAVDLPTSMFFGTRYALKSWAAAQVAAHVGWLAVTSGERLGGLIVSSDTHHEIRPTKGQSNLMRIFHHLAEETNVALPVDPTPPRLNLLLRELRGVVKTGSFIILISDFLGVDADTAELMSSVVRHNDMMMFWVHDKTEVQHWPAGRYPVIIDDREIPVDITAVSGDTWLSQWQQNHRRKIEKLAYKYRIPVCPVSCNREITPQLSGYLKK